MEAMNNSKLHVDVEEVTTIAVERQAETLYLSPGKYFGKLPVQDDMMN